MVRMHEEPPELTPEELEHIRLVKKVQKGTKVMLAGPWLGEFGHLLMTWVPIIRHYHYHGKFDHTVCVGQPGYSYLYKDFCTLYERTKRGGVPDRWLCDGKKVNMPKKLKKRYPYAELRRPRQKKCEQWKRKYIRYGKFDPDLEYDIVIHARATTKNKQAKLNWDLRNYEELVKRYPDKRIACIGTLAYNVFADNVTDRRSIPLEQLANLLASSKVCIGPSSGPMHFASLCGCRHVVWTDRKYQKPIKGTNRERYESIWNPFSTPVTVLDQKDWHPTVDMVCEAIG